MGVELTPPNKTGADSGADGGSAGRGSSGRLPPPALLHVLVVLSSAA
jgi:hypothetical protein